MWGKSIKWKRGANRKKKELKKTACAIEENFKNYHWYPQKYKTYQWKKYRMLFKKFLEIIIAEIKTSWGNSPESIGQRNRKYEEKEKMN